MSKRIAANLLPTPRSVKRLSGTFVVPKSGASSVIKIVQTKAAPNHPEAYALTIGRSGITIQFREVGGLRAASATLRQLIREYGRRLPCLKIRDWPDFARRGVMLDVSRGKVPSLATLLDLVEKLADLKINEFQIYVEHTFAYRQYKSVWRSWGALTARDIQILAARCRELGIDLVPNQNSFGHLRYFLADPRLKELGELSEPYEVETREFVRRPTTLAPNHPGTLPFLRGLYDEFLPNFSSKFFNVGCDETWDLGKGRSKALCDKRGQGQVYFDFLKKIHREVSGRGKTMMFWGDIILKYPKLIRQLPKDAIALNWGYEADHPFNQEAAQFAKARIPFYVCPGTSTWQTIIGKHDNGLANLKSAAKAGKKFGAVGYLNTDWGDGGHPQPLAVSWPLLAAGVALSWNASGLDETALEKVLNRDIYEDSTGKIAGAAMRLGFAHKKFGATGINETAFGTVIAAPKPEDRELFCRNGLKWFSKISRKNVIAAMNAVERERAVIRRGKYSTDSAMVLAVELDLAARMAAQSCRYMLWQQAVAAGKSAEAKALAREGIRNLRALEKDFNAYWPMRNKGTPLHSTPFFKWRIEEYSR